MHKMRMEEAIDDQLTKTSSLEKAAKDLMSSNSNDIDEKMKEFLKRRILIEYFIKNNELLMQESSEPTESLKKEMNKNSKKKKSNSEEMIQTSTE